MSPEAREERQEVALPVLKDQLLELARGVHSSQNVRSFSVGHISTQEMHRIVRHYAPHVLIREHGVDGPYCSLTTLPSSKPLRNIGLVCDIVVTFDPSFSELCVSVIENEGKAPLLMLPRRTERRIFPEQYNQYYHPLVEEPVEELKPKRVKTNPDRRVKSRRTKVKERPEAKRPERQKPKQNRAGLLREKAGIPPDQEIDAANFEKALLALAQEVSEKGEAIALPTELFPAEKYIKQICVRYNWSGRSKWWFRNLATACTLLLNRNRLFFPFNLDVVSLERLRNPQISLVPRKKEASPPEKSRPQIEKHAKKEPSAQDTVSLLEITEELTKRALETGRSQVFPSFPSEHFRRIYDEATELLAGTPHSTHTPRLVSAAVERILAQKGRDREGFRVDLPEFRDPKTGTLKFGRLTIHPPKRTPLSTSSR